MRRGGSSRHGGLEVLGCTPSRTKAVQAHSAVGRRRPHSKVLRVLLSETYQPAKSSLNNLLLWHHANHFILPFSLVWEPRRHHLSPWLLRRSSTSGEPRPPSRFERALSSLPRSGCDLPLGAADSDVIVLTESSARPGGAQAPPWPGRRDGPLTRPHQALPPPGPASGRVRRPPAVLACATRTTWCSRARRALAAPLLAARVSPAPPGRPPWTLVTKSWPVGACAPRMARPGREAPSR